MGSQFFKAKGPAITGGNQNQLARAVGAGAYASRGASIGAQKDLAAAQAVNKAAIAAHGPLKGTSAHPKGPKV